MALQIPVADRLQIKYLQHNILLEKSLWCFYEKTPVSLYGNCSVLPWKLQCPTLETTVSCLGTVVSYLGNGGLRPILTFLTYRKSFYVWLFFRRNAVIQR